MNLTEIEMIVGGETLQIHVQWDCLVTFHKYALHTESLYIHIAQLRCHKENMDNQKFTIVR